MRHLCTGALALVLISFAAPAAGSYDDAPWRATVVRTITVRGEAYTDTFRVWMDSGYRTSPGGSYASWSATQEAARRICTICTSLRLWPGEESRYFAAKAANDRFNYRPLTTFTFLPISISATGPMPMTGRPRWRYDETDLAVVTLKDGRTYTSMPGFSTEADPHPSLSLPGGAVDMCWQNKAMLGGRLLYTTDELRLLWDRNPLFKDRPTESTFLVPIDRGHGDRIELRDIVGIKLFLMGEWVDLQPQGALAERTSQR